MVELKCNSCKRKLDEGGTSFLCPECNKGKIVRCRHCRETGVKYTCPESKCEFSGPN